MRWLISAKDIGILIPEKKIKKKASLVSIVVIMVLEELTDPFDLSETHLTRIGSFESVSQGDKGNIADTPK
jgi:hypothetical protein